MLTSCQIPDLHSPRTRKKENAVYYLTTFRYIMCHNSLAMHGDNKSSSSVQTTTRLKMVHRHGTDHFQALSKELQGHQHPLVATLEAREWTNQASFSFSFDPITARHRCSLTNFRAICKSVHGFSESQLRTYADTFLVMDYALRRFESRSSVCRYAPARAVPLHS
jgi:hypothetical protein